MDPPAKKQRLKPPKRDFIGKPAPPGYVAGIGRGATGFTTRSDIGPAREPVASTSGASTSLKEEEEDLDERNYDEFFGYGGSLFKGDPYDENDAEADKIWSAIDERMAERGKKRREARERRELEENRRKRLSIKEQFSDLKADLRHVTLEEWESIPESGDSRNRKQRAARQDKFTPVPDSLLAHQARLAAGGERHVYLNPKANESDSEGEDQPSRKMKDMKSMLQIDDGQKLNIGDMSEYRSSYMSMQLSRISDPTGEKERAAARFREDYLKKLDSMTMTQITDTATLNEHRKQFTALRVSNPTFADAWIASARLEEAAGQLTAARKFVMNGCYNCPDSADLWLEAVRLQPRDYANALLAEALRKAPKSEKLWLKAAELEKSAEARRRIFEKARKLIPKSETLWQMSIESEPRDKARALLQEAVVCLPNSVKFWLVLAKLSPYNDAVKVLKEANEKNPRDRSIWLTAAKLQEHVGKYELVEKIIKLSVSDLAQRGVEINRAEWLREAADADRANFKITCREMIRRIIGWNISESERLRTWLADATNFIESGSINCARAVFDLIMEDKAFGRMESVRQQYANFKRQYGDNDNKE